MRYNIDDAYHKLKAVALANFESKGGNIYQICFYWWQFFYFLNQNVRLANSFKEKAAIIDKFAHYYEDISGDKDEMLKQLKVSEKDVEPINVEGPGVPDEFKRMMGLLRKERDEFYKHFRAIMKERDQGEGSSKGVKKARERKWMRS